MTDDPLKLEEVAFRFEDGRWTAYNFGRPTPWCSPDWSTTLGTDDVEDLFTLFRRSRLTFLPAPAAG